MYENNGLWSFSTATVVSVGGNIVNSLVTMVERSNSLIFSDLYTITWGEALKKEKMFTKIPFLQIFEVLPGLKR